MDIKLPGEELKDVDKSELFTSGIEEAVRKDVVKKVLMGETDKLEHPSYIIDLSESGPIVSSTLLGINTMLDGGDTTVYIKTQDSINKIGSGDASRLYDELDTYLQSVFGKTCKLLKSTINKDGVAEFKAMNRLDVCNLVLDM